MKNIKKVLAISVTIILLIIYLYTLSIQSIPDNIVIFEGEKINLKTILGLKADLTEKDQVIETLSSNQTKTIENPGKKVVKLSLFENIFLKNVNVDVLPKTQVIPIGNIAGIKLYTNGVLVVGMTEIEGIDNKKYKPYENTGIQEGDRIISINNTNIEDTEDLVKRVNSSNGNVINIKYVHEQKTLECSIKPVETAQKEYKLGLWVRDSAAGVGTVTFYDPDSKSFGALGHGITDIDTEQLIDIASGEFVTTKILNIVKGESGNPGRIQGTVDNQKNIGVIYKNTKFGIYGKVDNASSLNIDMSKKMDLALRDEIKTGKATIMCSLENGKINEYEIEIEKIFKDNNYDNKSMLIKVTDKELLEKTGGIIQRNEWLSYYSKWKICRCYNSCIRSLI
ncbi:stage IV sporulation protein B [Clostridium sp. CAG:389]|nr:stage IV sporulation protein B [Clostridium sp. CAG:389]